MFTVFTSMASFSYVVGWASGGEGLCCAMHNPNPSPVMLLVVERPHLTDRAGTRPSNSSRKMMEGAAAAAWHTNSNRGVDETQQASVSAA